MQQAAQTITMQYRGQFFFFLNADLLQWRAILFVFSFPEDKITYSCLFERRKYSLVIDWTRQFYIPLIS